MTTRRDFLKRTLFSAASLWVAPQLLSGCGSSPEAPLADAPWEQLQRSLQGPLLRPGSEEFLRIARPWNLRYADRVPAGIVRCQSEQDIVRSILWARQYGVPMVVRSGGHSYSGFSTTSGLLIDVSTMRDTSYDSATGIVTLGAGARNETVYENLRPLGRAITHGRCLEVGVAGLVLGGGVGFNMRLHGLTCDQLLETRMVLADGRVVTCNAQENSDLFWACRGAGGGNFGVNTSFKFQTYSVDQRTAFSIDWTGNLEAVLAALLEFLYTAPREMGAKPSVVVRRNASGQNELRLNLLGQLAGTPADLQALLAPIVALEAPSRSDVRLLSYWEAQDFLSEEGEPEFSYERSRYAEQKLSAQAQQTIFAFLRDWPGIEGATADWKAFVVGGAVADVAPDATAYVHRDALLLTSVEMEWHRQVDEATVAVNRSWLDAFHEAMAPFTSQHSYQNFIDERQSNYLEAYYGANLPRLVEIKRKYDPENVFRYPQSIPVQLG
jgi:FAD/FMN-containing dehydrogenase